MCVNPATGSMGLLLPRNSAIGTVPIAYVIDKERARSLAVPESSTGASVPIVGGTAA
jgi:hypothetical protein